VVVFFFSEFFAHPFGGPSCWLAYAPLKLSRRRVPLCRHSVHVEPWGTSQLPTTAPLFSFPSSRQQYHSLWFIFFEVGETTILRGSSLLCGQKTRVRKRTENLKS
jgi:hypothetical protein